MRPNDTPRFHSCSEGLVLTTDHWVPASLDTIFDFFSDASNLEALTPPWVHFRIVTPGPIDMREGTLINYRLRLHGLPIRWRTRISQWEPPRGFVDEQIVGPYSKWVHAHSFEAEDGGTRMRDRVVYRVPGGTVVHSLFVRRNLESIFGYRASRLRALFGEGDRASASAVAV